MSDLRSHGDWVNRRYRWCMHVGSTWFLFTARAKHGGQQTDSTRGPHRSNGSTLQTLQRFTVSTL